MNLDDVHQRVQLVRRAAVVLVMTILAVCLVVALLETSSGAPARAETASRAVDGGRDGSPEDVTGSADEPVYTFVSAPDLLNADFGDLHGYPGWTPGTPNSFNETSNDSLNRLYRDMASWKPDGVFVAGDEVRGHWDVDNANTGTFGPVGTPQEKLAAIRRAGDFYYEVWKNRFPANGIPYDTVYPAIGDHEIGDNPWPEGSFELDAVPTFKRVWADHFTTVGGGDNRFSMHPEGSQFDDTAYATYLTPKLLLVTVDTFAWSRYELSIDVAGKQLEWLRTVLAAAPEGTKILVQGHVPVLTPVRTRGSSSLHLDYGGASQFWQVLKKYGVDLYLNGEVHSFTAIQLEDHEPVQLSHGGLFAHGTTDYVVGRVYADGRITLDARQMTDEATGADQDNTLWQTRNDIQGKVRFPTSATSVGTMTLDDGGTITERSGVLAPYTPAVGDVFGKPDDVSGSD